MKFSELFICQKKNVARQPNRLNLQNMLQATLYTGETKGPLKKNCTE
jgi:hypothetical protein